MSDKSVSIVLPTYNESGNIISLILQIIDIIPFDWKFEILVIDDNSPDGTFDLVASYFKDDNRINPILRITDRGFAKSIRAGIEKATYHHIVVMDSDLTHDPADIPRLLYVGEMYDFVSGSRFCAGGRMADSIHYLASMIYNWVLRVLIRTQVQDNLGGYFTARREFLIKLPFDEIFFGYGDYFYRLIHYVQVSGGSIVEIPSSYLLRGHGESKSQWLSMIYTYTMGAIRLKIRMRKRVV